jgi:hypothetical protein
MKTLKTKPGIKSFTLIEVVIALAIVLLSLLGIASLTAVALKISQNVKNDDEALSLPTAVDAYLNSAGFSATYPFLQNDPGIYAYNLSTNGAPSTLIVATNNSPDLLNVAKRSGNLFRIILSPSTDAYVRPDWTSATTLRANSKSLLASYDPSTYGDAFVPIQVNIYPVPQVGYTPTAFTTPSLTYDTVLSR